MDGLSAVNMFALCVFMMCDWRIRLSFCYLFTFFSFELECALFLLVLRSWVHVLAWGWPVGLKGVR